MMIFMRVYVCIYTHMYICIYVCTHTYTYGSFYFVYWSNRGRRYRPGYFSKEPIIYSVIPKKYPGPPLIRNTDDGNKIETAIYIYIYT